MEQDYFTFEKQIRENRMELDYIALGKQIREKRMDRQWTQAELAERSGVEPSNISHIERGATKVSLPTLVMIANALEATMDELLYHSLQNNTRISSGIIADLLADCSREELLSIAEVIRTVKAVLRRR